jgi:hypothetical protein
MAYVTAEARQDLLDVVAQAIDGIGVALAALGEAYEHLDDPTADRLEAALYRPIRTAYGRAQRTHTDFARRHGLIERSFEPASPGLVTQGVKSFLERAVQAVAQADSTLGTLQDSMLPVEVGDAELRAGLSDVRRLIGELPGATRQFLRTLGR